VSSNATTAARRVLFMRHPLSAENRRRGSSAVYSIQAVGGVGTLE